MKKKGRCEMEAMEKKYQLCVGCGALHAPNKKCRSESCEGCSNWSACISDLSGANSMLEGKCSVCRSVKHEARKEGIPLPCAA